MFDKRYMNEGFSAFSDVLRTFLKESNCPGKPLSACIAFAGPVKDNCAKLTNRGGWEINGNALQQEFGIPKVVVVNDFLAVGYGLLTLNEQTDCVCLHAAEKDRNAPIACVGAGTGLGECFLTPDATGNYRCFPTEGGHAEFAPRNDVCYRFTVVAPFLMVCYSPCFLVGDGIAGLFEA
jgi:glucokinase